MNDDDDPNIWVTPHRHRKEPDKDPGSAREVFLLVLVVLVIAFVTWVVLK